MLTAQPFVRRSLIERVWDRGRTHIKLIGDLPVGSGALEEACQAAAYLAKYVAKNLADDRTPRLHRYEVAQGFQPGSIYLTGDSEAEVLAQACEIMSGRGHPSAERHHPAHPRSNRS